MSRAFTGLLLSAPLRRRLRGTQLRGFLATLAEQTGRIDLAAELAPAADPMPAPALAVAGLFNEALRLAGQGRTLGEAARTVEKAVRKAPDDVACLALAVMILTMSGRRGEAESLGRRAVALAPRVAALRLNLGNCLRDQQKYAEALESYETALELAPEMVEIRFNQAQCLMQLNRSAEARSAFEKLLMLPAVTPPARNCHASAFLALDRLEEAEALLGMILEQAPGNAQALTDLAAVYRRTRRAAQAEPLLQRVLAADPKGWMVHMNLSGLYHEMHRYDEAEQEGRIAYGLNPGEPGVLIALAGALSSTGDLAEAERLAREAWARRSGRPVGMLGIILERQGRYDEAAAIFGQCLADEPEKGWVHLAIGQHLLRQGDYRRGWAEFEWRWRWEENPEIPRSYAQPQWSLSARKGATVLVWHEQGLGDSVQFLRLLPLLAERGYRPILEIQKPILRLAQANLSCPVVESGVPPAAFDYHIPLLGLPHALGLAPDAIPGRGGYLAPDPGLVAAWRERLGTDRRPRIGVAWAGNPRHGNDRNRSIPLSAFRQLFDCAGARFISLQKEIPPRDADQPDTLEGGWIAQAEDFADSAALIANLDLVIGVDSAVIHLAGALGLPTWVLVPFHPDWRWMLGRDDSIWYESLRLFRQPAPGTWDPVLARVLAELRRQFE